MLALLGIIFIVIIVKFLYDNFATNNAANNWDQYKTNFPEEAHRLDTNKGLNMNVKPKNDFSRKQLSLLEIARNLGTSPELAQELYTKKLHEVVHSVEERDHLLREIRKKKIEEASTKSIDPDDGVAAVMYEWAELYFLTDNFKDKISFLDTEVTTQNNHKTMNEQNVKKSIDVLYAEFPEVEQLVKKGDRAELIEYLKKHPRAFTLWMESLQK